MTDHGRADRRTDSHSDYNVGRAMQRKDEMMPREKSK